MSELLLTLLALALVLLNGFFVAAEFGIVKLRATRAEELSSGHGLRGRVLANVRSHLDAYLSACQLGITLASLGLGWIGEPAFAKLIEPALLALGVASPPLTHAVAFAVAFGLISFLHIVLGELAPKSIAIRRPEPVSLWAAIPLFLFYWLMYPFIWLLNGSANVLLRWMGVDLARESEDAHSLAELKKVLRASHLHGELGQTESEILRHGLELRELTVGDVMQPLADLVAIDIDEPFESSLAVIKASRFTRYPVFQGDRHKLVGLLHIKDLLTADQRIRDIHDVKPYLRRLPVVSDGDAALKLLHGFRAGAAHIAAVTDDYGTVIGFVTFERLLEVLVGPIEDEFLRKEAEWRRNADGTLLGDASMSIVSLEQALDRRIEAPDANSIGGLVLSQLGRLPTTGERVACNGFVIEVLAMDGPRIRAVRIEPREQIQVPESD